MGGTNTRLHKCISNNLSATAAATATQHTNVATSGGSWLARQLAVGNNALIFNIVIAFTNREELGWRDCLAAWLPGCQWQLQFQLQQQHVALFLLLLLQN